MVERSVQKKAFLEGIVVMQVPTIAALEKEVHELRAAIVELDREIVRLNGVNQVQSEEIAKLEARLNTNSSNSSKPPSTDPPWKKPKSKLSNSDKRTIGAQNGHSGSARKLVPSEDVNEFIMCKPSNACKCGGAVSINESDYERKQVFEIPKIEPHVTEYQIFSGRCSSCSAKHRGILPVGVPTGILGPNALATIALFTGKYHLSKRDVEELFCDYFGLSICVGTVCNAEQQVSEALKEPYEEAVAVVKEETVVGADETGHKIAGKRAWMWLVLSSMLAVFFARASRSKKVAQEILGENFSGILISDRCTSYLWVSHRQLCWAHLIRDFNKLKDAGGLAAAFANPVLDYITEMFCLWHKFKDGEISRLQFQKEVTPITDGIESCLDQGKKVPLAAGLCRNLCRLKTALWTFINNEGVEPTNNDSERTLRQYVIWRKTSFGTQTTKGNEFVERILTAIGTCKRQNRRVFKYLTQLMRAHFQGRPAPSLLPTPLALASKS